MSANLITNGSFEVPLVSATGMQSYGANSVNPLVGWTVGGGGLVATLGNSYSYGPFTINTTTYGPFAFNAADGAASLNLGKSNVGQSITTVAGSSYNVTFSVGNVVDTSGVAFGTDSFVQLWINGKEADVAANSAGGNTVNWKQFTFPFTAAADTTSTFVQFVSFDSGHDGYCGLDAVSVTPIGQLQIIQQPSDAAAGDTIAPPVTVAVEDSSGAFVTNSTDQVTLRLAPSADTGTLTGTLTQAVVNGIATFSDLSINEGGSYNLIASDGTLITPVLSSLFNITGDKLVFQRAPVDGTANDPLNPIKVELQDGQNNVQTTDSATVITLTPVGFTSANPIKNNTATVVDGIATFSNVILTKPGFYQLQATDGAGDAQTTSGKFKVAGDKLKFLVQPKSTDINTPIPLTVEILNNKGKVDTTATSTLVLSLNIVSGGKSAQLLGTTQLQFVAGKAIFTAANGPRIDVAGTYTLTATEEDLSTGVLAPTNTTSAITSNPPFAVAGLHLVMKKQPPSESAVSAPIPLIIQLQNSKHRVVNENIAGVQLSLITIKDGVGATLGGTTTVTFVAGVATFTSTAGPSIDAQGIYQFSAAEASSDPATPVTTGKFQINGYKLVLVSDPVVAALNDDLQTGQDICSVNLLDPDGKPVSNPAGLPNLELTLTTVSGHGVLTGNTTAAPTVDAGSNTVFYALEISITLSGTYRLAAVATDVAGDTIHASDIAPSKPVQIRAVNPSLSLVVPNPHIANVPLGVGVRVIVPALAQRQYNLNPSVGFQIVLNRGKYNGTLTAGSATQVDPLTIRFASSKNGSLVNLIIDAAGVYSLTVGELVTPLGAPFDPSNATSSATCPPATIPPMLVLPDRLVFIQQPPAHPLVGQSFDIQVAAEDLQGNILTVISPGFDPDSIAAVALSLVFISKAGANALQNPAPVNFVNGVATFSNLSFIAPGIYTIQAREQNFYSNDFFDPPVQVTAKSILIRVTRT